MYKIENEPTFDGSIKIVSLGREQTMEVTFRAKTRTQYQELLKDKTGEEVFLELVEKWNVDAPLNKDTIGKLEEHQPGVVWAVIGYYGESLLAARKGN